MESSHNGLKIPLAHLVASLAWVLVLITTQNEVGIFLAHQNKFEGLLHSNFLL